MRPKARHKNASNWLLCAYYYYCFWREGKKLSPTPFVVCTRCWDIDMTSKKCLLERGEAGRWLSDHAALRRRHTLGLLFKLWSKIPLIDKLQWIIEFIFVINKCQYLTIKEFSEVTTSHGLRNEGFEIIQKQGQAMMKNKDSQTPTWYDFLKNPMCFVRCGCCGDDVRGLHKEITSYISTAFLRKVWWPVDGPSEPKEPSVKRAAWRGKCAPGHYYTAGRL